VSGGKKKKKTAISVPKKKRGHPNPKKMEKKKSSSPRRGGKKDVRAWFGKREPVYLGKEKGRGSEEKTSLPSREAGVGTRKKKGEREPAGRKRKKEPKSSTHLAFVLPR